MDNATNPFQFDAGQADSARWPMAPVSTWARKVGTELLNHAIRVDPRLTQLEHVKTFELSDQALDCVRCAVDELVNRKFDMPWEGGVQPVQMITEAYVNAKQLRYVIGSEYATYLRSVAPAVAPPPPATVLDPLYITSEERLHLVAGLQLLLEVGTVFWNFATIESARDGREPFRGGAFGLTNVKHTLAKLGADPRGGRFSS